MHPRGRPRTAESGFLEEPVFVHGFDPGHHVYKPPPYPSPWKRHFDLGRQNPAVWNPATGEYDGGWMLVSRVVKGGCKARSAAINRDRSSIDSYVNRNWPLERWQLRMVTISGTWCDRELYMRFLGTLTPEEDALDRKRRKEYWEARQGKIIENKAKRAAAAREKAAREELEARVQIRGRRKPGG